MCHAYENFDFFFNTAVNLKGEDPLRESSGSVKMEWTARFVHL